MIRRGMLLIRFRRLLSRSRVVGGGMVGIPQMFWEKGRVGLRSVRIVEGLCMRRAYSSICSGHQPALRQSTKSGRISGLSRCVTYVNICAHHTTPRCNEESSHEMAILDIAKREEYVLVRTPEKRK
jgi:hypothetical protein